MGSPIDNMMRQRKFGREIEKRVSNLSVQKEEGLSLKNNVKQCVEGMSPEMELQRFKMG